MNQPALSSLAHQVIGSAIEVHRAVGPGLLESAYAKCLQHELRHRGISFAAEVEVPLVYRGASINCHYRVDLVVDQALIVEIKAVDALLPVHSAQVLTYMKLLEIRKGLLINFNVPVLKSGLRSLIL